MKPLTLIAIATIAMTCSCKSSEVGQNSQSQTNNTAPVAEVKAKEPLTGGKMTALPKAVIYKTNGDYNNNVAINLSSDGKRPVSYPAPTDVNSGSAALPLENGWLLDRRGAIGANTAFLKYTYEEYAKLPQAPTTAEIMQSIIPDAKVTETRVLPILQSQAIANPSELKQYLN